jgi:hypothetical protein
LGNTIVASILGERRSNEQQHHKNAPHLDSPFGNSVQTGENAGVGQDVYEVGLCAATESGTTIPKFEDKLEHHPGKRNQPFRFIFRHENDLVVGFVGFRSDVIYPMASIWQNESGVRQELNVAYKRLSFRRSVQMS